MTQQPRARSEQLVVQELPGELLIYDLERHKASCLNQTASGVWKKCDGARSVAEIAAELTVEWGAGVDEELVWVTLEKLGRAHLLCEKVEQPEVGIPRREMMRRLRLASVVAAPLIASILAPTALASSSNRASGQACTDGAICASKVCFNGVCV
jgi:hypothetical protein